MAVLIAHHGFMTAINQSPPGSQDASRFVHRPANNAEVHALALLGRESFRAAFGPLSQPAALAAFLDVVLGEVVVVREIADREASLPPATDAQGREGGRGKS